MSGYDFRLTPGNIPEVRNSHLKTLLSGVETCQYLAAHCVAVWTGDWTNSVKRLAAGGVLINPLTRNTEKIATRKEIRSYTK